MTQLKKDLKAVLKDSLDHSEWNWIAPHVERQAVIVVSQDLNLIDVGVSIAQDEAPLIEEWIKQELLSKPLPHQIRIWERDPKKRFAILIVQPYVLIQEQAS